MSSGPQGLPPAPRGCPRCARTPFGWGGSQVREVLQELLHPGGGGIHADPLQAFQLDPREQAGGQQPLHQRGGSGRRAPRRFSEKAQD